MNLEKLYWDSIWWIIEPVRICGKPALNITHSSVWTDHSPLRRTFLHIISLWVPSSVTGKCWFEIHGKERKRARNSSINVGNYLESVLKGAITQVALELCNCSPLLLAKVSNVSNFLGYLRNIILLVDVSELVLWDYLTGCISSPAYLLSYVYLKNVSELQSLWPGVFENWWIQILCAAAATATKQT